MLGFKYVRVLNIPNFCKYDGSECASACNYERVLNVPGFRLYHVSPEASVAQGSITGKYNRKVHREVQQKL